jgi:sugar-specific transcriptional regulator TrmB
MTLSAKTDLEEVNARASNNLRELGFGAHESAVILALNRLGSGTVSDLSTETGIHHANLYSVLDSLAGRGLVVTHEGRPRVYQFAPLVHLEEMLTAKVNQLLTDLKELHEARTRKTEVPALIYTIRGESDVVAKISGMISRAQNSILIVAPSLEMLGHAVLQVLEEASQRGLAIQAILGTPTDLAIVQLEQRIKEDTMAIDLVVDSTEALISMPDLSICGWADNPLISMQLEGFLQQTWDISRKV